jgi:Zn-dependent protease
VGRSFLICRIAGVPIRAHWSFFLLPVLFLYRPLLDIRESPGSFAPAAIAMLMLVAAVVCHELAHALTARSFGGIARAVTLLPFGGVTEVAGLPATPGARVLLSLSGPLCNLALAGVSFGLATLPLTGRTYIAAFFFWNLVLGLFNLLPAPMLDGGHALRAVLCARLGPSRGDLWSGRIGMVVAGMLIITGLAGGYILISILGFIAGAASLQMIRQNRFAARSGAPRVPETGDFRSWRLPKKELDAEIERKRAAGRADADLRRRVDELLKKISQDGMGSLTDDERAFLDAAGSRFRKQGR